MKTLNIVFWVVVVAIGVTFGMTVYTAVKEKKPVETAPHTIPTPAEVLPH